LVARLERAPNMHVTEWNGHKIPSWCRGLRHPNVSVCGPVHLLAGPESNANPPSHVHLERASLH
jgi:hypothetical protein